MVIMGIEGRSTIYNIKNENDHKNHGGANKALHHQIHPEKEEKNTEGRSQINSGDPALSSFKLALLEQRNEHS